MENMIKINDLDISKFLRNVYEMSVPMGMGFLHYQPGNASDEMVESMKKEFDERLQKAKQEHQKNGKTYRAFFGLDYVQGRQCKMQFFLDGDGESVVIYDRWMDHSDDQLAGLLQASKLEA